MNTIHISTTGRDAWSGSAKRPLASLSGARDRIRERRAAGKLAGQVTVHLAAGRYELKEPLRLGYGDSDVTWRGEPDTIIDGGAAISRWKTTTVNGVEAWVADLPAVKRGEWNFRELFVDGKRRPRARYPKFGYDTPEALRNVLTIGEIRPPVGDPELFGGDCGFKPKPGDLQDWPSLYDAEIVVLHFWTEDRLPDLHLNSQTGWIESSRRTVFNLREAFGDELARYYVDNLFEALTEPGEWYLDRHRGKLFYIPLPGETPDNTAIFAPRLRGFVVAEGVPYNRDKTQGDITGVRPVRNVRFEGLTFRHADWIQPEGRMLAHDAQGMSERPLAACPQGAITVPGSIAFEAAEDCVVTNCRVEHVGFYGIEIGPGCRRIEVSGNHLEDLGAGGVKLHGGELDEAVWRRTGHCSVTDNTITQGGRIFHAGIGVLLGNAFENVVAHNHIHDFFYTGISLGWSWGYRETISRDNLILCNHIHNIGQGLLSDMGAIYCLGVQPGTVIAGNHVHEVLAHDYGSWGLYLDEGSSHMVVEQNFVHDMQGPCFNQHFGRENIVRHNVFMAGSGGMAAIGRPDDFWSANIDHNLFVTTDGIIYRGGYAGSPIESLRGDTNWIVMPRGTRLRCAKEAFSDGACIGWDEWLAAGHDRHTTLQRLSASELPRATVRAMRAFLKAQPTAEKLGLTERTMWTKAGIRPPARRKPLWQPLWRR